jgi:hypothetical protein
MSHNTCLSESTDVPGLPRFSLRTLLILFLVASPILTLVSCLRSYNIKRQAEIEQQTKMIWATLNYFVREVEQIQTQLGRSPSSTEELKELLGHPMFVTLKHGLMSPVYYERNSDGSYNLVFSVEWLEGFSGDFLMFQSSNPKAGWVVHYD